jgi:ribonuclease HI
MAKIVENAILVYTDGSLKWKGRKGGYGFVFVYVDRVGESRVVGEHSPPGIHNTTNNRMELMACIEGLKNVIELPQYPSIQQIRVCTDSRYVRDNFALAAFEWSKRQWTNRNGRPVLNADLWKELIKARTKIRKRVEFEWVKAHAKGRQKDPYNDLADKLADASRESPFAKKQHHSSARRKQSTKKTVLGSVKMQGQEMDIRISSFNKLPEQKLWAYRYEVTSVESPYFGCLDWIFSEIYIRSGNQRVRVNRDTKNPRIVEYLGEAVATAARAVEADSAPTSEAINRPLA